jgi:hypothetical protein
LKLLWSTIYNKFSCLNQFHILTYFYNYLVKSSTNLQIFLNNITEGRQFLPDTEDIGVSLPKR